MKAIKTYVSGVFNGTKTAYVGINSLFENTVKTYEKLHASSTLLREIERK